MAEGHGRVLTGSCLMAVGAVLAFLGWLTESGRRVAQPPVV
jgi:hypothetical protein